MNGWIGMGGTLLELNLADVILAECRGAMMLMLFMMLMIPSAICDHDYFNEDLEWGKIPSFYSF